MTLPSRWASQIAALAALLAAAFAARLVVRPPGLVATPARCCCISAFTLRHLYLLDRALDGHRRVPLFETRGLVGGDLRARRQAADQGAQPQEEVPPAAARGAREHGRAVRRRHHLERRPRDHVVQPRRGAAARARPCDRRRPPHRQPAAPSRFRRLSERADAATASPSRRRATKPAGCTCRSSRTAPINGSRSFAT